MILTASDAIFFIYFAVPFVVTQNTYRHGESDSQNVTAVRGEISHTLSKEVKSQMDEASVRATEYGERLARREDCQHLMVENPDVMRWIRIEGTPVDYPVIQTPDEPDYYYRRGFDREYSTYSMIYMGIVCTITGGETVSPSYILRDHHMKNSSVFASLEQYGSEECYKEHPLVEFGTENEFGSYEIIDAVRLPAAQLDGGFAAALVTRTEGGYENLARYVGEYAPYKTGVDAQWPEQLLTLTTCEYIQKDGYLLVAARRRQG